MHKTEIDRLLDNAIYGHLKFLYVAPERLQTEAFLERFKQMNINMVAIDESHCISQWGHDFRPSYLEIKEIRQWIPEVPFIALTATATDLVKQDIIEFLDLKNHASFSKSFKRENIRLIVRQESNKRAKLVEILTKIGGSAIVYADTRKHTKDYADLLNQNRISARYYHAGLDAETKSQIQADWINDKVRVMCATNAFGMGIDKANVRLVIHPHVPSNPEAFYQEAGRAGRDGKTSLSVVIYDSSDLDQLDQFLEVKYPPPEFIKMLYSFIYQEFKIAFGTGAEFVSDFDLSAFAFKHQLDLRQVYYGLKILEKSGFIALNDLGRDKSRVMFLKSHTDIYKFQVANPSFDDLLTVLLRSYGGLFEHMVAIDEFKIAQRVKLTKEAVHQKLKILAEKELINYQEKTNKSLITFLKSRVQENYISIPKATYEVRKKADKERVELMKSFVSQNKCRMQMLLEYFGETKTEPCLKCDYCTESNSDQLNDNKFNQARKAISYELKNQALDPTAIPNLLNDYSAEYTTKVMRWMLDNDELEMTKGEKIQKVKK